VQARKEIFAGNKWHQCLLGRRRRKRLIKIHKFGRFAKELGLNFVDRFVHNKTP
jgi:hypothetical protein